MDMGITVRVSKVEKALRQLTAMARTHTEHAGQEQDQGQATYLRGLAAGIQVAVMQLQALLEE